ncbi:hypothetical protein IGI00_00760, partial [Bacillus thuringiensis]|nr:hypothetical protein [Bacillus thuringiensis]
KFETVINADAKAKKVVLKFNKKMDAASLADSSNYLVRIDGTLQTLTDDVATLSVSNDATVVTITFAETIKGNDVVFATGKTSGKANVHELQVLGVKDTSGNVHDKFNGKDNIIDLTVGTTKLALAQIDKDYDAKYTAELVDRKTVKVKFSTVIKSASSNAFTSNTHKIDSIQVDGTSTVTVKFKDEIKTDGSDLNLVANLSKFVDVADNEGPVREETISPTTNLLDSVAPVLDGEPVVKDATITFTFSESLKAGGSDDVLATDLTVTRVSDNKDLAISDYTVAVNDKKQVVITLSDKREAATAYKVTVKNAKYIIDTSDKKNAIADFSKTTADKVQTDSTIGENTAAEALKVLNKAIDDKKATLAQYTAVGITKLDSTNFAAVNAAAAAVLADLNTAKTAVEGATYTLEATDTSVTAAAKVKAAVEALSAVSSKSFAVAVTEVSFSAANLEQLMVNINLLLN